MKFRIYYEPQFVRGFTSFSDITFSDNQNDAPYFVSKPIATAVVGRQYTYMAQTYDSDPTGQPNALISLTYSLLQKPTGMEIDDRSGRIMWKPEASGRYNVSVQARDPQGRTAIQNFEITVVAEMQNVPPHILSLPRTVYGAFGIPYAYNLNAWDVNGDEITYAITQGPHWLSIDPKTGFVSGIPHQGGVFPLTIQARDNRGGLQSNPLSYLSSLPYS